MDHYQSVIIIAVIPPGQIVIVALIQNVGAPQIAHQTQNKIVAETHDRRFSNNMPNKFNKNIELCVYSYYLH